MGTIWTGLITMCYATLTFLSFSYCLDVGPATFPSGTASGLLLPATRSPRQPAPTVPLGCPLPIILSKLQRQSGVPLPIARQTGSDHLGDRGARGLSPAWSGLPWSSLCFSGRLVVFGMVGCRVKAQGSYKQKSDVRSEQHTPRCRLFWNRILAYCTLYTAYYVLRIVCDKCSGCH